MKSCTAKSHPPSRVTPNLQTFPDQVHICANTHITANMLSSEQILENAAHDGSIDMYEHSIHSRISCADPHQRRMASRAREPTSEAA
jgi:hypothetical protein